MTTLRGDVLSNLLDELGDVGGGAELAHRVRTKGGWKESGVASALQGEAERFAVGLGRARADDEVVSPLVLLEEPLCPLGNQIDAILVACVKHVVVSKDVGRRLK